MNGVKPLKAADECFRHGGAGIVDLLVLRGATIPIGHLSPLRKNNASMGFGGSAA